MDENDLSLSLFLSLSKCVFLRACLLLLFLSDVLFVRRGFCFCCKFAQFSTVPHTVTSKSSFSSRSSIFFEFDRSFFHTPAAEKQRGIGVKKVESAPPPLSLFPDTYTFKPFFSAFCKTSDENTRVQTHSLQTLRESLHAICARSRARTKVRGFEKKKKKKEDHQRKEEQKKK